jgi:hypothetical protein
MAAIEAIIRAEAAVVRSQQARIARHLRRMARPKAGDAGQPRVGVPLPARETPGIRPRETSGVDIRSSLRSLIIVVMICCV